MLGLGLNLDLDLSRKRRGVDPSTLPVLAAWYRPDTGTTSAWTDKSGNGRALLQSNATKRSTVLSADANGYPAFLFDGVDDFMTAAFVLVQPITVIMVYKSLVLGAAGVNDILFDGGTNVSMVGQSNAGPQTQIYTGTFLSSSTATANGAYAVLTSQFNGATSLMRRNRVQIAAGNAGTGAANGFTIAAFQGGTRPTNIAVAEIQIYTNAILPPALMLAGEQDLAARYATP